MLIDVDKWLLDKSGRVRAPGIIHRQSPNKSGVCKPRVIVLHDTEGGLDVGGSVSWLCNPQSRVSAHFVVGRDGSLYQLVSVYEKAWHAGVSVYNGLPNVNNFGLGIEIVNPGRLLLSGDAKRSRAYFGTSFDNKEYNIVQSSSHVHMQGMYMHYTEEQIRTVAKLCVVLKNALKLEAITTHFEIAPGRKTDTGPLFPSDTLKEVVFGDVTAGT